MRQLNITIYRIKSIVVRNYYLGSKIAKYFFSSTSERYIHKETIYHFISRVRARARKVISSFSNANFMKTLNSGAQYREELCRTVGYVCLPRTRTSTERCDVKLCLFLAVHVYVPSSALRCTVSINSVPLATLCLMLVGSFMSPDNNVSASIKG